MVRKKLGGQLSTVAPSREGRGFDKEAYYYYYKEAGIGAVSSAGARADELLRRLLAEHVMLRRRLWAQEEASLSQ